MDTATIPLPHSQAKMMKYVCNYFLKHGLYPASRETQREFGFKSQTAVLSCWKALEKKRFLHSAEERQARAVMPMWGKVIEHAREIWHDFELSSYYVQMIFECGSEEAGTYRLPHMSVITLWLMQEERNPTHFHIELVKE